jgi:hypothetical protein
VRPGASTITPLALALAVALAGVACSGGDDDDAQSDVAGPSPVTEATTTTPASTAIVSLATTVATTAATTAAPTAPPTTAVPSPPPAGPVTGPYVPVDAPNFPARSAPPASGEPWPDGDYYVVVRGAAPLAEEGSPTPRLAVTAYQLLTGPDAIAAAQADGVGLDSDVYIPPEPSADGDVELAADLPISVARPDRPGVSYAVSGGELARLVSGAAPDGAPEGYQYVEFPFLLTMQGGRPAALQQLWAP